MPLKHHTETAYIVLLGIAIGVSGLLAALLPPFPEGLKYWSICIALAVLYPASLSGSFRENRADKEFRLMHWFPAGIFLLWFLLGLLRPYLPFAEVLRLGFFVLWSLPLVVLGMALLVIFALHVIRRRALRITLTGILLVLFAGGAIAAETTGINPMLAKTIFTEPMRFVDYAKGGYRAVQRSIRFIAGTSVEIPPDDVFGQVTSSTQSVAATVPALPTSSRSIPPIIAARKPNGLPASGPGALPLLALSLLSLYSVTLHRRARGRI